MMVFPESPDSERGHKSKVRDENKGNSREGFDTDIGPDLLMDTAARDYLGVFG